MKTYILYLHEIEDLESGYYCNSIGNANDMIYGRTDNIQEAIVWSGLNEPTRFLEEFERLGYPCTIYELDDKNNRNIMSEIIIKIQIHKKKLSAGFQP